MSEVIQQFLEAMMCRDIIPPSKLIADGAIHRCNVKGKGGKGDGAYLLHLDGIPAGGFENWRDGLGWQNWRARGCTVLPDEAEILRRRLEEAQSQREDARIEQHRHVAQKARALYSRSNAVNPQHEYLTAKNVPPVGLRQRAEVLFVPMINAQGDLINLQRIYPDGSKRFLYGGQVYAAFSLLGVIDPEGLLYACEGWATGATIYQQSGTPVACAMNCGNLLPMITALLDKYPRLEIIIAGDDDRQTAGNPGRSMAVEAAIKTQTKLVFPEFCRTDCQCSDFNDIYCCQLAGVHQ